MSCRYPQSHPTARRVQAEIAAIAANRSRCTSFYLDTVEGMSNDVFSTEGEDHHQGLARSHRLADGSIYFFLSHSEVDEGDQGSLSAYRYAGPTDGEHVQTTRPLTVAPMRQIVMLNERHPSDITFLPDVNGLDAGYVFVTLEYDRHAVACYRWDPRAGLRLQGTVVQGLPTGGPVFLFLDRSADVFYLGIASPHWGWVQLLRAPATDLFPGCTQGSLDVSAFTSAGRFPFPVLTASQTKLVRDVSGSWNLLAFRSDPDDDPNGADFVDVYGVTLEPFHISPRLSSTHVFFPSGDTGFASTGTLHVEPSGRLLIGTSYRWAKDEGPGSSSFVSRVDECPSA
jgi:hypothetical protein